MDSDEVMDASETFTIRPAGRHILTIGRDLIQDPYAAVIELVKNAYDADSPDVNIAFESTNENQSYKIIISDAGHGMPRDTVIGKWMVPSTSDKLVRKTSPNGRTMQGRKGVGRYSASILGSSLLLESVSQSGEKTTLFIDWNAFEQAEYLADVDILIETTHTEEDSGTTLTIAGKIKELEGWDQRYFDKLRSELKKMISPISGSAESGSINEEFTINLRVCDFPNVRDLDEAIAPFPIFDLYEYRIHGTIGHDGKGALVYSQAAQNTVDEELSIDVGNKTECGTLFFDFRVYDRDKDAIEALIARGLKNGSGDYVGKLEARRLLTEFSGIGVYRNGFRVRPLGDAAFDWLGLNKRRVQNPSMHIGSDQIIGYVQIQSEEDSNLIEKSARDGLKDNNAFDRLKNISTTALSKLEINRFEYRKKEGLGRSTTKIERELDSLFSFDNLKRSVRTELKRDGLTKEQTDQIVQIIDDDAASKNKVAEEIRQTVAIYQAQASLGKIINVILHEGRRPLSFFSNQIPTLDFWMKKYTETKEPRHLENFLPIAKRVGKNAEFFVTLFKKLDPLAVGKRGSKNSFDLAEAIRNAVSVFDYELNEHNITVSIAPKSMEIKAWHQDIYSIFTNLVDNSVYWIIEKNSSKREIQIEIVVDDNGLQYIDYRDSGPGIDPRLIRSGVIFEPNFSTKISGTGLGLAIAGESAYRNGLDLKAYESDQGAYFRIQPFQEDDQ